MSKILAVCCVGSLNAELSVGTILVPDDYFNLSPVTIHGDGQGHIVPRISEHVREIIIDAVKAGPFDKVVEHGTYVQTVGPRFETKAEVRFLSTLGDVIGMTAASEALLSQELGMEYAMLCMIDNCANGLVGETLTETEFKANVARNQTTVEQAVKLVVAKLA